jgi:hypothetical protein
MYLVTDVLCRCVCDYLLILQDKINQGAFVVLLYTYDVHNTLHGIVHCLVGEFVLLSQKVKKGGKLIRPTLN